MQQNTPEQNYYQENEIDLKQLFKSLSDRKWFIFVFTGIVTILTIAYALTITPTYKAQISFLSPSVHSILQLNKIKLESETSETSEIIYRNFLNKVMSNEFQRKIFDKNGYLTRLNPYNNPIKNLDRFIVSFTKSVMLESGSTKKNEISNYEKPIIISIEGADSTIISDFLNDLVNVANTESVDEFLAIIQQKIDIRLEDISREISLQKHLEKRNILNKIQELSYALEMATELGIKGNNLSGLSSSSSSSSNNSSTSPTIIKSGKEKLSSLRIDLSSGESLPKWYLFGANALKKEIDILTRNMHQPIPAALEVERIKLESYNIDPIGINAMQLNQHAYPIDEPINKMKLLTIAVAFIAGFMLSILLVFIMNAFRKDGDKDKANA